MPLLANMEMFYRARGTSHPSNMGKIIDGAYAQLDKVHPIVCHRFATEL